jgi:membrane peptidoglycan carboxypeptidase
VLNSERRAGAAGVSAVGRLLAVSVGAGLLVAAVAVPLVGLAGVATRNVANAFNTLKVAGLGQLPSRSEILAANGQLIAYYYPNNIYRIPVSYNQISPVMRRAVVAIEDNTFWQTGAFDLRGTLRALATDLGGGSTQGGSTIAQEYVKNALILTATNQQEATAAAAQTLTRKIRELRLAAQVEHELTKPQLLAAYLNAAYFENSAVGIQVAAERYFSTSAADLTLPEAALLAGLVRNPTLYDPITDPSQAEGRRNIVLARMAQVGYISQATAKATEKMPLGLKLSAAPLEQGCVSPQAASEAFFCDYVMSEMKNNSAYAMAYKKLNSVGGLKIYTTLQPADQNAANRAVNWVLPAHNGFYNPNNDVDTEVMIQPGTGRIRAIAVDRPYGTGPGQTTVDYAVPTPYDGGTGVQTGSSSKLFTLLTALKQGVPFGFSQAVVSPTTVAPYFNCKGQDTSPFQLQNAEGPGKGTFTLYNGTTQSINVFYAHLEQKVGLCQVVQTAASLGLTWANGVSLLRPDPGLHQPLSADNYPSFTLGFAPVSPLSMANAYATVASNGIYCTPTAISQILTASGQSLPVMGSSCHRVLPASVTEAANTILQGVLESPGTAAGRGIGVPAAAKTGTANSGFYAAFAGYTPHLAGYVSVFNPVDPTTGGAMLGQNSCYREDLQFGGGLDCPGQMFGDNAPGATWQMSFTSGVNLGSPASFVQLPQDSPYYSEGSGINSPKPVKTGKGGKGGNGGGNGGNPGGGTGGGTPPTAGPLADDPLTNVLSTLQG